MGPSTNTPQLPPAQMLQKRDVNARTTPSQPPTIDLTNDNAHKENQNPTNAKTGKPSAKRDAAANATKNATSNPKKRKSDAAQDDIKAIMFPTDAPEIDDDDPRLFELNAATGRDTCQKTRRKIRDWIESGAQKVGEFQREIGVSSRAYTSFMNRTGTWDGDGCDTYWKAALFFKKRELAGLPLKVPKVKKAKKAASTSSNGTAQGNGSGKSTDELLDTGDIDLPGEHACLTPVYMTCEEVRRAMRALLAKSVTQAALARALSGMYPPESERKVSPANLRYFLGQKGHLGGNTNTAFYAGYCFFEKQRILKGKPKSKFREEMEDVHGYLYNFDKTHQKYASASLNRDAIFAPIELIEKC